VQRRHVRGEVSGVHTLDTKDANIALFDACDEMRQRPGWQSNIAPTLLIAKTNPNSAEVRT